MLNLNEVELIPYRTKGRARNGAELLYLGVAPASSSYDHSWLALDDISGYVAKNSSYYSKTDGAYGHNLREDCLADVVAVSKRRELQLGDVVRITGLIFCPSVAVNGNGSYFVRDMEVTLTERVDNSAGIEAWAFTSRHYGGTAYTWYANRRDMTFVRRG